MLEACSRRWEWHAEYNCEGILEQNGTWWLEKESLQAEVPVRFLGVVSLIVTALNIVAFPKPNLRP